MIQMNEAVADRSIDVACKYDNIAQVSRERIRRAGQQIVRDSAAAFGSTDVGFRTLRIDTTNTTDVLRTPNATDQLALGELEGGIKRGRSGEDLLFQVLIDWGLELSLPIARETIEGHDVFVVDDGALIACFDGQVSPELVRAIAERKPLRAVFRDDGFASDDARINAEQVFREVSPATDIKVI